MPRNPINRDLILHPETRLSPVSLAEISVKQIIDAPSRKKLAKAIKKALKSGGPSKTSQR